MKRSKGGKNDKKGVESGHKKLAFPPPFPTPFLLFFTSLSASVFASFNTLLTRFVDIFQARGAGVGIKPGVEPKAELQVSWESQSSP